MHQNKLVSERKVCMGVTFNSGVADILTEKEKAKPSLG